MKNSVPKKIKSVRKQFKARLIGKSKPVSHLHEFIPEKEKKFTITKWRIIQKA